MGDGPNFSNSPHRADHLKKFEKFGPSPDVSFRVLAGAIAWLWSLAAIAQVPPPEWARSVEVVRGDAVVRREPAANAPRRGSVSLGTRLPLRRRVSGTGCAEGFWVEVGPSAFLCEANVRPSPDVPYGEPQPPMRPGHLLPHRYAFVRVDGTRAFARPSDYLADDYVEALGDGFGLVVTGARVFDGVEFIGTRRGLWVERDALGFATGSDFAGAAIGEEEPLPAWVQVSRATVHSRPGGPVVGHQSHRTRVRTLEEQPRGWMRLEDGRYMRRRHLAVASAAERPPDVGSSERWLDVDLRTQILVAYEGDRPVFATLISAGRGPDRSRVATPLGAHRVWVKLATSDMDDLQRSDVERNYAIEAVPWVQYFEGSNGLHAAFWHDQFGRPRSHGCINLSPRDARFLFGFTEPELPPGWTAILPTDDEPGTVVRIRRSRP